MIPVIKTLISQVFKDTGIRVVKANTTDPIPTLPYAVYNTTSSYIKDVGQGNETYEDIEDGLIAIKSEQYKMVLSINVYALDDETAIQKAMILRNWFTFHGTSFIQKQDVAIAMVGNVENRTTFLVDSYEYKHGFDVQLRLTDKQMKEIDYIEEAGSVRVYE